MAVNTRATAASNSGHRYGVPGAAPFETMATMGASFALAASGQ